MKFKNFTQLFDIIIFPFPSLFIIAVVMTRVMHTWLGVYWSAHLLVKHLLVTLANKTSTL